MFRKILLALVALIGILVAVIATRPDDFRVTRSATFNAPPAAVFEQVNDFQKWEAWSPWAKLDPNVKNTFEGPAAGKGAVFRWAGNLEVGEGEMTIAESRPPELILLDLHFIKPFEGTSTTEFTFKPSGDQTAVTWTMFGKNNFVGKAMSLVMDCDKMMGPQFEKGLENMRAVVEAKPKP